MAMIPVIKDGIQQDVEESTLDKIEGVFEDDHERTTWVEYRFPGDDTIVHRSCHVTLKRWPGGIQSTIQGFTS